MFKRGTRLAPLYCVDGDDGDGSGGGGGGGFTQADVDSAVDAAVNTATSGLKSKNAELVTDIKGLKAQTKAWDGLDPEAVRNMMDRMENDEELKLIAEGKHSEAWDKRLEKVGAKHQSAIDGVVTERDGLRTELDKSQDQVRDLIIKQQVVTSFISEKGVEQAIPDVVLRAKSAFTIEEGVPICRDVDGEIVRGADGPITIPEWVAARKQDAPHWFPPSQGAGATGAGGRGGGSGGSDIDAKMEAAASSGDMVMYRKLHLEKKKGSSA
jgi:hypothetical protein